MLLRLILVLVVCSIHRAAQAQTKKSTGDPPASVPRIAQLLSVRVGYNGVEALERKLGMGKVAIGAHPNSCQLWRSRNPRGVIWTDGFGYGKEGYVIEMLGWSLPLLSPEKPDRTIPVAKRHPRDGWMGIIYPGMTKQQVLKLIAGKLPSPQRHGDEWTWKAKGFVRVNIHDTYHNWTATLTFRSRRLYRIDIECE